MITGRFTDHHVHLQLVDAAGLADSVLGTVVDLGGTPGGLPDVEVAVRFAGAFLTPIGGYPSDRAWAPAGSVREIQDMDAAAVAVSEMVSAGAALIKVTSNSTAGPVFADELFAGIVSLADAAGLDVVAHAEGPGEAQRAARLGARMLAHAPFSERLNDREIGEQAASIAWISTLAIHSGEAFAIAVDNLRRFHAAGGRVLYGTDMGNGPTPVGLNLAELAALREAGLDDAALLRALAPDDSHAVLLPDGDPARALLLPPEEESADVPPE